MGYSELVLREALRHEVLRHHVAERPEVEAGRPDMKPKSEVRVEGALGSDLRPNLFPRSNGSLCACGSVLERDQL